MAFKKVYTGDFSRVYRAMLIDSRVVPFTSNGLAYGYQIEQYLSARLSILSANARGYKIEDNGTLVGCYAVDYSATGAPFVAIILTRKVFTVSQKQALVLQADQWTASEPPLVV